MLDGRGAFPSVVGRIFGMPMRTRIVYFCTMSFCCAVPSWRPIVWNVLCVRALRRQHVCFSVGFQLIFRCRWLGCATMQMVNNQR